MNEEIEYAEMLEIPVSTINVIKKKRRTRAKARPDLKEQLISKVNDSILTSTQGANESSIDMEGVDVNNEENNLNEKRHDEIKNDLFSEEDGAYTVTVRDNKRKKGKGQGRNFSRQAGSSIPRAGKASTIALSFEFAAACVLCAGIFLTNVFMPQSAINTFFRSITFTKEETDARVYTDFKLTPIISVTSDAELTLSESGVLSFTDKGCVYPSVDGNISSITKSEDGRYEVRIAHTDSFYGILSGLDYVYYAVGENVFANVPIGYTKGETEVQATMYSKGELLDCFTLNENNCLVWAENK